MVITWYFCVKFVKHLFEVKTGKLYKPIWLFP